MNDTLHPLFRQILNGFCAQPAKPDFDQIAREDAEAFDRDDKRPVVEDDQQTAMRRLAQ